MVKEAENKQLREEMTMVDKVKCGDMEHVSIHPSTTLIHITNLLFLCAGILGSKGSIR